MKVLLCLLGFSLGLVAGSLDWARLDSSAQSSVIWERAIDDIPGELRAKRSAAAGGSSPVTISNFTFANDARPSGTIQYSGSDNKVIFLLTYNLDNNRLPTSSELYRSINYGRTFTDITTSLTHGSHILYQSIHVAPNNNKMVVFRDSQHAQIYITKNEGATFTTQPLTPNTVDPKTILFHPTLATSFLVYDPTTSSLYVTTDLGQTLTKLSDNVPRSQYQWGTTVYDDTTTVYYNVQDPNDANNGDYTLHLYKQNAPYGSTPVEFDPNIGKHDDFLIVDRYMFIQKTISGAASLWVSYDRLPFTMAHIPSTIPHQNYIVDSIKSLQALVIVEHTNGQYNLYLSEEKGQYYSLSLPDIVVDNGGLDLELVDSMNATYIANQNIGSNAVRTLISFDNGGNWQTLRAPNSLADGTNCVPPSCSLHLHMSSSQYWRTGVYSQQSAPGIIIAHGTTGATLGSNPDLYLSRDGGINWIMSLQSSWGVTVLDHGGLIVAAKDYHQGDRSSVLMYTCDEGATWSRYSFSPTNYTVFGVVTEPGETTTVVSLYGIEQFAHPEWSVIQINFTSVFTGLCQPTDYYWWQPWDERSSTDCLLGSMVSIQRRKPTVCCLNNQQFSRVVNYTTCDCVADDFECDYGYKHTNGYSGPCVRDNVVTIPDMCQGNITHYSQSKGYRKIGGDVCTSGVEVVYKSVEAPCCKAAAVVAGSSSTDTVVILLGVALAVTMVIVVAQFSVIIVTMLKLKKRIDYSRLPTEERFVVRADSPPPAAASNTAHFNIQHDDDELPIEP